MDIELLKVIVPAGAGVVAAVVAVGGWYVAHRLNVARDVANKRRELRIQYLLDAYRRLEKNANRQLKSVDEDREFESAIADIQLLGTTEQLNALNGFLEDTKAKDGARNINYLLGALRTDLRSELELESDSKKVMIFRFDERRKASGK